MNIPAQQGFYFPAEWQPHAATWLTWPHTEASWTRDRQPLMLPAYIEFIKTIARGEQVCINAHNETVMQTIALHLLRAGADMSRITLLPFPTNDSWCRDHGPAFLVNPARRERMIVNWGYNAWGNKYPPYDRDDLIPVQIAHYRHLDYVTPNIIMEGGSVEFNGAGTVLTSRACLLNQNRNPTLSQAQIEQYLCDFYGVQQVLWVEDGIVGDDTDGHIDDTVRFVSEDTVIAAIETNPADANYPILQEIHRELHQMRLLNGKPLNVVELPMPDPVWSDGLRLPASYANFYIANAAVIVPTFRCARDQAALNIIGRCFPDRPVVGIDSTDIVWGLGSFHCPESAGTSALRAKSGHGSVGVPTQAVWVAFGWLLQVGPTNHGEALPAVITPVITQRQHGRYQPDGDGAASALQVQIGTAVGANALFCKANKTHKC